jgi:hypothetical protein
MCPAQEGEQSTPAVLVTTRFAVRASVVVTSVIRSTVRGRACHATRGIIAHRRMLHRRMVCRWATLRRRAAVAAVAVVAAAVVEVVESTNGIDPCHLGESSHAAVLTHSGPADLHLQRTEGTQRRPLTIRAVLERATGFGV